ncbi:Serine/threonine-protein kinase-like protein [Emericellopsis cladophorae]|uniref:non-specific serine/threonine protein kinase n=1 Tax=Emericellopsis cladophorae TaxID=2686198 RepID=A0A9Q0BGI8_9HYPO|nr:Serine/threonine-protein kinase-like protein [Emericellopsis cladophorae]KAI6783755.1 Serine/threonine-protein kinase-like protein [Emericellopsis cladophorae]
MASLQVRWPETSVTKQKAIDDAVKMQKRVVEDCNKGGKEPPPYQLSELIGKGSFGRVYKATALKTKQLVAVKIIDIDQSDTMDPRLADTYSDLLKEINALQMLGRTGAKNVNLVIEALPVAQSMWMITEYCAGGSVSTLMQPTAPGGLQEKWVIPILRETAEAIFWVHGQGIIHRDIKCANVLVTEPGDVQLCDFGVAGVIETKFDKRTTVIGTPHWMAPELFDDSASYGTEVDIWAFGAMVYEIASGLPPNVHAGMDFSKLGNYLKNNTPRLEGDQYSPGLKDLISYCLQHDPAKRPNINQIQRHGYIHNTSEAYPTNTLSHLVKGFKLWESQGGARRSLFGLGGAQAPDDLDLAAMPNDEWNFSTTADFDRQVFKDGNAQDVFDAYGNNVDYSQEKSFEATARPQQQKVKGRRRPPPQLPSIKAPLEKIFDPNTMSNYEDNSRTYYGRLGPFPENEMYPPPTSDLPLRNDSAPAPDVRESLIDLDASLDGGDLASFVDLNTIRAGGSRTSLDYNDYGGPHNYDDAPLSDPVDGGKGDRRTQDWKFPSAAPQPPASANPEVFRFPATDAPANPAAFKFPMTDDPVPSAGRPSLLHRPTEPIPASATFNDLAPSQPHHMDNRASVGSLIDLDMGLVAPIPHFSRPSNDWTRPSTSHSEAGSVSGSEFGSANPFELEKHTSVYATPSTYREPSIYVSDDSEFANAVADIPSFQDPHAQDHDLTKIPVTEQARPYSLSQFADMDPEDMDGPTPQAGGPQDLAYFPPSLSQQHLQQQMDQPLQNNGPMLPLLPMAPSPQVLQGQASNHEVKEELRRMAMCLEDHLHHLNVYLDGLPVRNTGSTRSESGSEAI